ncbi:MAG: hypothetical protein NTW96_00080 [Planctomycetia bacterium]|nr:hypothetical protein [Planctomycetia bacterium]
MKMEPIAITDVEKMVLILETFSDLDDIRWSVTENYNQINYCHDDLTPDEQLLTHWLCYITDRQMRFEGIWEVGGYVISHMVRAFSGENGRSTRELLLSYVRRNDDKVSLECRDCSSETGNTRARLKRYGQPVGEMVTFTSRFMADDLVKIYHTLEVLGKHHRKSLASFLATSLHGEDDYWRAVRRMASALDRLTYAVRKVSATQFDGALDQIADDATAFSTPSEIASHLFGRKRLWCSVRDYLKSPEFNAVFVAALKDSGEENPGRWDRTSPEVKRALGALELPGDVWNNATVFRDGLFSHYLTNERPSWDMPRTIRRVYEILGGDHRLRFYPEQLDVTFDFVPRMCKRDMCDVCLFGKGIADVCHQKSGCLCPVALTSCGYQHRCEPDTCRLKKNAAVGHCRSATSPSIPT